MKNNESWEEEQEWVERHLDQMLLWHRQKQREAIRGQRDAKENKATLFDRMYGLAHQATGGDSLKKKRRKASFHATFPSEECTASMVRAGECMSKVYFALKLAYCQS